MSVYPKRINTIVNMISTCTTMADIGCDHAYVCIKAVCDGKAEKAFACDLNKGPLLRAEQNIRAAGLSNRITTCLSDGLKSLKCSPEVCIICGMGGLLIREILEGSEDKLTNTKQLVLGPHSEVPELRKYLTEMTDFKIVRETVLEEQEKFYVLMDVQREATSVYCDWKSEEYITGKKSLQTDINSYQRYIQYLTDKYSLALQKIEPVSDAAYVRKKELEKILVFLKKA